VAVAGGFRPSPVPHFGPQLRFHIPLIKPDVRFSRIRLSDKDSCVRPRKVACSPLQSDQAQPLLQVLVGKG
jgi:hypothetical protein